MGKLVHDTVEKLAALAAKGHSGPTEALKMVSPNQSRVGLILGTGWGDPSVIKRYIAVEKEIDFFNCGIRPAERIEGHAGKFLFGTWDGIPVVVSSGRLHMNQVHDDPTRLRSWMGLLLAFMGTERRLIVTQSVGGLVDHLPAGTLAVPTMTQMWHLEEPWMNPGEFMPPEAEMPGEKSPFINIALEAALKADIVCVADVFYIMVVGTCFGGKGDRKTLKALGFQTVGMSLIPELSLVALENSGRSPEQRIRVAPVQFVSDNKDVPTHEGNTDEAHEAAPKLGVFLNEIIHAEW